MALICATASASAQQLQYAEPVSLSLTGRSAHFEAYGRRFDLSVSDNRRALEKLPPQRKAELGAYRLLRGSVDGAPGSWVRLTQTPAGVEGAIWDGSDLYAVTRYERIERQLTTALDAAPGQTVVYRLSDLRGALPRDFCGLDEKSPAGPAQKSGLDQYQALLSEISGVTTPGIDRQLEISLIGDVSFQDAEPGDPIGALLARFNIVEGIYGAQLGVLVMATDVRLMPTGNDPFQSTSSATLLEQLSAYRRSTPAVRARGLAHLVTGKDLDGTTAGIAYVGGICDAQYGVSLSQQSFGTTISALIMAHELGHNFGASHDGAANTACASVPAGYIMAPSVSGNATFSQCSLGTMRPVIESASCVTQADFADVTFAPGDAIAAEGGVAIDLPFTVRSVGTRAAENVTATVTLPSVAGLALESATASQGSCMLDGLVARCEFDRIEAGQQVRVTLSARASSAGNFTVQARTDADNDSVSSNDGAVLAVSVRSGIDAALQLSASAAQVAVNSTLELFADVRSQRAQALRNAVLTVTLNQPVLSATMPGAACTTSPFAVTCTLAEVPAGAVRRLSIQTRASTPGSLFAGGNVSVSGDGDFSNNTANATVWVQAERDIEITAGPGSVELGVGSLHEIPYTVRAIGPQPAGDVTLFVSVPAAIVVDSLAGAGAACSPLDAVSWTCALGGMAPGSSRVVRLRVRGTRPVTTDIVARADAADDGFLGNNVASVQLRIDHRIDLAVPIASGGNGIEDVVMEGQVLVRSEGGQPANDATLEITLNAAGALRSAAVHNGDACALLSATQARCALPTMARNAQVYVDYTAEFAEPGAYNVTFRAVAPNDTAPANDVLERVVLVRPFNDVAVAGNLELADFVVGQSREKTFTVRADRRALAQARFRAPHYLPAIAVASIRADGADCHLEDEGGVCDFADMPPYASLPVVVTYRAVEGSYRLSVAASVSTAGDVVVGNDQVRGVADVQAITDIELRAGASVTGVAGDTLDFPTITLVNGEQRAFGARLEIVLPAQLTLVSLSAGSALCSGTQTLRCDFADLEPDSLTTVSLTVRASATGTFATSLRAHATNDGNPANDTRDITVAVGDTPAVATRTADSPGGGGSFEWLGLLYLAAMTWVRMLRRVANDERTPGKKRPHFFSEAQSL